MLGHKRYLLFAALPLTGCSPKPQSVSIDFALINPQDKVQVDSVQSTAPAVPAISSSQPARPQSRLYTSISDQDIQGILDTLQSSRAKAFDRALQELRRQYQSSIDAAVTDAQAVIRESDERDWEETSQILRELLEQYAPKEGELRMRLVALRDGLTPNKQSISLSDDLRQSLQVPVREKVKLTEQELEDWLKTFEAELTDVLVAYRGRRENRQQGVAELGEELRNRYEADAHNQAKEIVDTSLRSQSPFDLILNERLAEVSSSATKSSGLNANSVTLAGSSAIAPVDLQFEAKLFTETNNYVLKKGARDVTKEFMEWRKKRAIGH